MSLLSDIAAAAEDDTDLIVLLADVAAALRRKQPVCCVWGCARPPIQWGADERCPRCGGRCVEAWALHQLLTAELRRRVAVTRPARVLGGVASPAFAVSE